MPDLPPIPLPVVPTPTPPTLPPGAPSAAAGGLGAVAKVAGRLLGAASLGSAIGKSLFGTSCEAHAIAKDNNIPGRKLDDCEDSSHNPLTSSATRCSAFAPHGAAVGAASCAASNGIIFDSVNATANSSNNCALPLGGIAHSWAIARAATKYTAASKLICELLLGSDLADVNDATSRKRNRKPILLRHGGGEGQVSSLEIVVGLTQSYDLTKLPKWTRVLFRGTATLDSHGLRVSGDFKKKDFKVTSSANTTTAKLKPKTLRIRFDAHGFFNLQKLLKTDCIYPNGGGEESTRLRRPRKPAQLQEGRG